MTASGDRFSAINETAWATGDYVSAYATRDLHPAEVVLLARYSDCLSGRVLELGCGAGRLLGYLAELATEAHGIDISERMVAHCRAAYPSAYVHTGTLTDPGTWPGGQFDQIWLARNLIDVLEDERRGEVLDQLAGRTAPGGMIIFSSHNLAAVGHETSPGWLRTLAWTPPLAQLRSLRRAPTRRRNRRRLGRWQFRAEHYAVINDSAQDFALLHYHIGRDDQEAQLAAHGWRLVDCLDLEGRRVAPGEASHSPDLHYVAQRAD